MGNGQQALGNRENTDARCLMPAAFLSGKRWHVAAIDEQAVLTLQQKTGLPEVLCRLLVHRGVSWEEAESYLSPSLKNLLPDPFHLKDMDKAVARLSQAISAGETIGVFGDYDVDGATSSALLLHYFRWLGIPAAVHIPDRQKEGYGPNLYGFSQLRQQGARLIITVDTGTLAHEVLAQAAAEGYEVIVIDHHLGEPQLPPALAVVNPNRFDETSPLKQLAAVGVTFMLLIALQRRLREAGYFALGSLPSEQGEAQSGGWGAAGGKAPPDLRHLLDVVALGTVADVVPLTGLNRAFVVQGLKVLHQRLNPGLAALMDVAGLHEPPAVYHLGFLLGPRINAGGRVGQADLGVRLLTTPCYEEALPLAQQLDQFNLERKAIEQQVLEQAMEQAARQVNQSLIMVEAEGWHEGVIGIVAGRIKEQFNRPTAAIAWKEGKGKASARSVSGVDLGQAIIAARQQGLLLAGGGHAMAAGFTVAEAHHGALQEFLEAQLAEKVTHYQLHHINEVEGQVPVSALTPELAALLEQAGPYGAGNATPRFLLPRVRIVQADILKHKHLRLIAVDTQSFGPAARVKVMGFNQAETALGQNLLHHGGRTFSLIGKLKAENWQGRLSATFLLEDAAFSD